MDLTRLTSLLNALSVPTRARIFFTIFESHEALHHGVIAGITGISGTVVSHHLKVLSEVGLVDRVPSGKYSLFFANKRTLLELASFFDTLIGDQSYVEATTNYSDTAGSEGEL